MKQPVNLLWNLPIMAIFLLTSCDSPTPELQEQESSALKSSRTSFQIPEVKPEINPEVSSDLDGRIKGHRIPLDFFGFNEFDSYDA